MMHEHGEASNCSFRTFWPTQPPEGGGHLGGRGRVVVQVLPAGHTCHPLLPTSHPSILGEPALPRPLQKAPLLTSTYAGGV